MVDTPELAAEIVVAMNGPRPANPRLKLDLPAGWSGHHEPDDRGPEDLPEPVQGSPYTRELQAILENAVDTTPGLAQAIDALRAEERMQPRSEILCDHPVHKVVGYQILDESYVRWCTVCGSFRSDDEWVMPEKGGS